MSARQAVCLTSASEGKTKNCDDAFGFLPIALSGNRIAPVESLDSLKRRYEMRSFRKLSGLLLLMGASVAAGDGLSGSFQQPTSGSTSRSSEAPAAAFPKDV